jgi:hypothetical protein
MLSDISAQKYILRKAMVDEVEEEEESAAEDNVSQSDFNVLLDELKSRCPAGKIEFQRKHFDDGRPFARLTFSAGRDNRSNVSLAPEQPTGNTFGAFDLLAHLLRMKGRHAPPWANPACWD